MKCRNPQAGQVGPMQFVLNPLSHFLGGILGISDGEDFVGPRMTFANQIRDALGQNCGLPRARTGDDQERTVDVLNSFALAVVGLERSRT